MVTTYWFFMITQNVEDDSESERSNQILTIAGAFELTFKLLSTYYGWTK